MNFNMNTNGAAQQLGVTEGTFLMAVTAPEAMLPVYLGTVMSACLLQILQSVTMDTSRIELPREKINHYATVEKPSDFIKNDEQSHNASARCKSN